MSQSIIFAKKLFSKDAAPKLVMSLQRLVKHIQNQGEKHIIKETPRSSKIEYKLHGVTATVITHYGEKEILIPEAGRAFFDMGEQSFYDIDADKLFSLTRQLGLEKGQRQTKQAA